jgi:PD-(D/E)XK nuclease superfamily
MHQNEIGTIIVDCAVKLHKNLGPGLLESVYEVVLAKQLQLAGLPAHRQVPVSFIYEGISFDEGFRGPNCQSVGRHRAKIRGDCPSGSQKTVAYLLKVDGAQIGLFTQLW